MCICAICQRFGVSRQTFYTLQAKFLDEGTGGLLPKRPGPRGPRKLTAEVLAFVSQRLGSEEVPSTTGLQEEIQGRFGVAFHRRTLEKLVKDLRAKKNAGA
ncbi:MAG: transposase [Gemmatimonadales bacterium]